ncbi:MAG TPA: LysR family transcriptional regulator [Candidatus Scatomorpha intestinavium]|uniref:LysR family transcriptional regulator n=1 Tax=Candidatus Scatomorpha intestinavium TaxID=2840922 RepID=A0A9D0ZDK0_9FIRM|nr:LysR family transcriptional regulator [Candidatus Scatomorpha intestinavium]
MEIRNLYTFLQVASTQNFTQASRILGYSQSNVSTQIQQLEEDVGAKLFDRIGRGVVLTQYGQQLVPYAEQIVSLASKMNSMLWSAKDMIGVLRLGMIESLFDVCFERLILRYTEHFPKVKVDLTLESTAQLLEMLKKGQLDVACLIDDPLLNVDWNVRYEKEVEISVVAGRQNRLINERGLSLAGLAGEKFILMEDIAPYNVHFYHTLAVNDVKIQMFLTLQSARMARNIVEDSGYLSYLPLYAVQKSVAAGKIVPLKLLDYTQTEYIQVVLHSGRIITPQIQGFLEDATAVLENTL